MKSLLRYRKTALIICAVLFGFFFVHLTGAYIYSNGKYVGLPGGSVSIGMVSDADSYPDPMNPLSYGSGAAGRADDMIYNLLFRSLIRYNSEKEIFEWDLANCDISDLTKISCQLRDNALWSDGTPITGEDVIATMTTFKDRASSRSVRNALAGATIKSASGSISIESRTKNNAIIEALSYPIIRTDVLDQLKNNRLKKESYITSGPFIYEETFDDQEYNFHRITFKKNPNYKKADVWLEKFHFKIFPDVASMQKSIATVTMVIPPRSQESMKLPVSFKTEQYANYEFYGAFFQITKMDQNLRNILHKFLAQKFKESIPAVADVTPNHSLFQSGAEIMGKESLTMSFSTFMSEKGYRKKSALLSEASSENTTLTSGASIPKLQYFANAGGASILYSDDPAGEISLFGNVPTSTTSISINGYTLQEYTAGAPRFVYKITTDAGTLKSGKNEYNLILTQRDGSTRAETLTIYRTLDKDTMAKYQSEVDQTLIASLNTPEKITEREKAKQEKITEINALDDSLYYNAKHEPFSLKLAFVSDREPIAKYAEFSMESLKQLGILLEPAPLTTKELDAMIKSGEKNYDIIIVGVRSPGTIAHLGSTFFSSENGNPNFANINNNEFVNLFESLKNITDRDQADEIHTKIETFMNEQSFFFPISQPEHKIYVHMDVKGFHMPDVIPSVTSLSQVVDTLSTKQDFHINTEWKSIGGLFSWIFSQISS